jgi:hypothetical protein
MQPIRRQASKNCCKCKEEDSHLLQNRSGHAMTNTPLHHRKTKSLYCCCFKLLLDLRNALVRSQHWAKRYTHHQKENSRNIEFPFPQTNQNKIMSGVHYVTEPNAYLEPKIGKSGYAAQPAKTVIEVFRETVQKHGNQPALCYKRAPPKVIPT